MQLMEVRCQEHTLKCVRRSHTSETLCSRQSPLYMHFVLLFVSRCKISHPAPSQSHVWTDPTPHHRGLQRLHHEQRTLNSSAQSYYDSWTFNTVRSQYEGPRALKKEIWKVFMVILQTISNFSTNLCFLFTYSYSYRSLVPVLVWKQHEKRILQ